MVHANPKKLTLKPNQGTGPSTSSPGSMKPFFHKSWGTWLLASLGSFAIFLLRFQAETLPAASITEYAMLILGSFGVHQFVGKRILSTRNVQSESRHLTRTLLVLGVLVILAPWLRNFAIRGVFGGRGEATELVWLGMLQHAAVWQAAVAKSSRQEWTSFLLSCFMMLFGVATSDRNGMIMIVVPFGLLASWWLLSQYWKSVAKGFVAYKSVPLVRIRLGIIGALVCLTAIVGFIAVNTGSSIISLDGFMPTSGGKGGNDQAARQGVGDGDMMVAAKDQAFTFGPIESEVFLESQLPSLYDLATEKYGEAKKPNKEISRAVSLEQQAQHTHEKITESKQKSREFSTLRTPNQNANKARPGEKSSKSILHVIGSLPIHLRLESYDSFDGFTWSQTDIDLQTHAPEFQVATMNGKPWVITANHIPDIVWPVRERATIKIVQYKSVRIPSPSLTTHVHVDKIDQADFYSLTPDGQLCMPSRPYIPQLTVLHLLYQIPSLHTLRDPSQSLSGLSFDENRLQKEGGGHLKFLERYLQIPASIKNVGELRSSLLSDIPISVQSQWTDWQKVEAIVDALRSKCVVDPTNEFSADIDETVSQVLATRRATDYQLASTAVMLLRNWRIPSRLVTGFYCSPDRWDRVAGMAEILSEDMHTWAEVYVHGAWIPIEPSGTFLRPREHRSWYQFFVESIWKTRESVLTHPGRYATGSMLIILVLIARKRVANALASLLVMILIACPETTKVRFVFRLLRFREWLSGIQHAKGTTLSKWLVEQLGYIPSISKDEQNRFLNTVQRLAYAPASHRLPDPIAIQNLNKLYWHVAVQGITDLFRVESIFLKHKKNRRNSKLSLG